MPLYEYKCAQCGKVTEVRHGFDDGHDAPCPACGGTLARVFSAPPIVFKGSGFYVNDSRPAGGAKTADAAPKADAPKADGAKSDTTAAASASSSTPSTSSAEPAA